ncbi:indoleamine 2,3-dioxygenase 1-like isoform X2 [Sminthopsis crassicaudata]|uniref:indoleamine 2,3-dioxygenase 1-like isoform X2 n=1 Tax=Sminthopsis crassicaudata TaxID=9301 RepID=UPI003D69821E
MDLLENPLEHPEKFHISEDLGFILEDPLEELPDRYQLWVKLAKNLSSLVEKGQFRKEAEQVLPRNIAVPFCDLSKKLGLPPIMVYADCVLANWKKKDPLGSMTYDNMDTLFAFPGGDCSKGFFLVSLLVEKAAASAMKIIPDIFEAVRKKNLESLKESLQSVASSVSEAHKMFQLVHEHVNPNDFFNVLRVFLAGWKNSSLLPKGLIYEGVSETPMEFAGGSAAQSSIMQCFDALLGIQHTTENDEKSAKYLEEMRNYMPLPHKIFLEAVASHSSVRDFVSSSGDTQLKKAYNECVKALVHIRNYHLQVVNKYIITPSSEQESAKGQKSSDDEVKGTGGTHLLVFLRSVRDTTKQALLEES